jgi:hypothetical protein
MANASLLRLCVAHDGRVKANFSDNSILVLNAAGSGFVLKLEGTDHSSVARSPRSSASPKAPPAQPNGSVNRQLSEYALSRHLPQLRVALEFRNMHLDQPFFCQPLLRRDLRPQVMGSYHKMSGGLRELQLAHVSSLVKYALCS